MANTYLQIYLQAVFAVKGRSNLLPATHKEELYKYITGIVGHKKQKLLAIGGMPDHVHIFIGLNHGGSISELIRDIKANSSRFINENGWIRGHFEWQKGFGGFSYSHSQIDQVVRYILNQETHHARRSFKEEYLKMLQQFAVEYDARFLFDWVMDDNGAPQT